MKINTEEKGIRGKGINERIAAFVCGVMLIIVLLITSAQAVCYWIPGWWHNEYAKYNTPQYVTGEMSLDDAVYITEQMLEYCIGRLDSLDETEATIDGVTAPFFTDREKTHLEDCREIFLAAVRLRIIALLIIAVMMIAVYYSVRARQDRAHTAAGDPDNNYSVIGEAYVIMAKGYLKGLAALLVLAIIITLIGMYDFTFLFTKFHELFFDNDLWILDPRQDNLVNVMQEEVFSDAAITIAGIWAALCILPAVISAVIIKRSENGRRKEFRTEAAIL